MFSRRRSLFPLKLKGRAIDIIQAHQEFNDLKVVYRREREEVEYQFQKIYNQAV